MLEGKRALDAAMLDEHARDWTKSFVIWYNAAHRHSAIRFVTPDERHEGRDKDILARRHRVYQVAREDPGALVRQDSRLDASRNNYPQSETNKNRISRSISGSMTNFFRDNYLDIHRVHQLLTPCSDSA